MSRCPCRKPTTTARKEWISTLAKAPPAELQRLIAELPAHDLLRPAEVGAVMVRGRVGGTGAPFNLGEMSVTRCSVRLADGTVGHAWVQGRDKDHARRAAVVDALMQTDAAHDIQRRVHRPAGRSRAAEACGPCRKGRRHKGGLLHHGPGGRPMTATALSGGFDDAPVQSARAFREILEAMARPGTIRRVSGATPPAPLSVAAGTVLLTLVDPTTKLHLAGACDCADVRDWVAFHLGAPLVRGRRGRLRPWHLGGAFAGGPLPHRPARLSRPLGHPDRR